MSPRDWILLVVALSPARSLQPLQLQKVLCLIGSQLTHEQLQCSRFYSFEPGEYGPFTAEMYSDAEELDEEGLIDVSSQQWPARHYRTTSEGAKSAEALLRIMDDDIKQYVIDMLDWITSFELSELLRNDMSAYPALASKIRPKGTHMPPLLATSLADSIVAHCDASVILMIGAI